MRLQLTAVAAVLAAAGDVAAAQEIERGDGTASTTIGVYEDDDATTIVTSLFDGEVGVADDVAVRAHVLIDSVSSASVDVVSAATPRFQETRVESGAGLAFMAPRAIEVGIAYVHSKENDWKSNAFQLTLARELAQKNARVSASFGTVGNHVGRSGDPTFEEHQSAQTYELGISQLIDRRTLASATYTHQRSHGWHSSPYRYVATSDGQFSMLEAHPDSRSRHALSLRAARYVWKDAAVDLSYRLYRDDWGVLSHTLASSLRYAPGETWDLRLRARYYAQGAAHFWRKRYDEPMAYMSADRELSTFWNTSVGAKLGRRLGPVVADAKLDVIRYRFLEFELLDSRVAVVASAGLLYPW